MMRRVGSRPSPAEELLPVSRASSGFPSPAGGSKKRRGLARNAALAGIALFGVYALVTLARMGAKRGGALQAPHDHHFDPDHPWHDSRYLWDDAAHAAQAAASGHHAAAPGHRAAPAPAPAHGAAAHAPSHAAAGHGHHLHNDAADAHDSWQRHVWHEHQAAAAGGHDAHSDLLWQQQHHQQQAAHHDAHWQEQQQQQQAHHDAHWQHQQQGHHQQQAHHEQHQQQQQHHHQQQQQQQGHHGHDAHWVDAHYEHHGDHAAYEEWHGHQAYGGHDDPHHVDPHHADPHHGGHYDGHGHDGHAHEGHHDWDWEETFKPHGDGGSLTYDAAHFHAAMREQHEQQGGQHAEHGQQHAEHAQHGQHGGDHHDEDAYWRHQAQLHYEQLQAAQRGQHAQHAQHAQHTQHGGHGDDHHHNFPFEPHYDEGHPDAHPLAGQHAQHADNLVDPYADSHHGWPHADGHGHHADAHAAHGGAHDDHSAHSTLSAEEELRWHLENDALPDPEEDASHHVDHAHAPRYLHHPDHATPQGLYTLTANDIDGRERKLSDFAGRVTLVVNVATKDGLTDANYRGLQSVYDKYHEHGLEIFAFPSNQFGQEPGGPSQIKEFARNLYHSTFPLFEKADVNGLHAHPIFHYLKRELPVAQGGGGGVGPGKDFVGNFHKIVIDQRGRPVRLLGQAWDQAEVENAVYDLLLEGEREYEEWLQAHGGHHGEAQHAQHGGEHGGHWEEAHAQHYDGHYDAHWEQQQAHYEQQHADAAWQQHHQHEQQQQAHHDAHWQHEQQAHHDAHWQQQHHEQQHHQQQQQQHQQQHHAAPAGRHEARWHDQQREHAAAAAAAPPRHAQHAQHAQEWHHH